MKFNLFKNPTRDQLKSVLYTTYKIRLALRGIREFEFDNEKNVLYDESNNTFYIKYHDSPLPYSIEPKLLLSLIEATPPQKWI